MLSNAMKKHTDFKRVYEYGTSCANRYLVMYLYPNGTSENRIGISVSKKVGNSVVRHRTTRLIRESVRLNQERMKKGFDFIIIARAGMKGASFRETESAFLHLCRIHKIKV